MDNNTERAFGIKQVHCRSESCSILSFQTHTSLLAFPKTPQLPIMLEHNYMFLLEVAVSKPEVI